MGERLAAGNLAVALLANTAATVTVLAALIATLAPVSGAHFNPVVTLVALANRQITPTRSLAYVVAQVLGCCCGAMLAHVMFELPVIQASTHARTGIAQWVAEVVADGGSGAGRFHFAVRKRGSMARARLDRWRILVHRLHVICESGDHRGAFAHGHFLGNSSRGHSGDSCSRSSPAASSDFGLLRALAQRNRNGAKLDRLTDVTIYHNPKCETSRNTLGLIRNAGIEPVVIEYLQHPPSREKLAEMIGAAGLSVRGALREKGTPYAELGLADSRLTDDQLLDRDVAASDSHQSPDCGDRARHATVPAIRSGSRHPSSAAAWILCQRRRRSSDRRPR